MSEQLTCALQSCRRPFTRRAGTGGCPQRFCCKAHGIQVRVDRSIAATAARHAALPPRSCGACGKEFVPWTDIKRFCSDRCRERVRKRDPVKRREYVSRYAKAAWRTTEGRLRMLLRNRVFYALREQYKSGSVIGSLGCSIPELKAHLERKFRPGMTWENWSRAGWHIDHIRPIVSFNLSDPEQFKVACHFTNLQPLWAKDNLSKHARIG